MFKGKITKIERPLLNIFATYSHSFSNDEKDLMQNYLQKIVAPVQRVREVCVSKDCEKNGLIHIYEHPQNIKIASLYLKEIKVLVSEH